MGKQDYILRLIGKDGSKSIVLLQTPEAQGWLENSRDLKSATLMPTRSGMPVVRVDLKGGQELVYYRKIQGKLSASTGQELDRVTTHYLGYTEMGKEFAVAICEDGTVRIGS